MNEKELAGKLVGLLFMSRDYSHLAHLKTDSYAHHTALNDFYDEILDFADQIAEVAQGKWGVLDIQVPAMKGDLMDPSAGLGTHLTMVENIGKKCGDRGLSAIIDEVFNLYNRTIYKLNVLK